MREIRFRAWDKEEKVMYYYFPLAMCSNATQLACQPKMTKDDQAVDYIDDWTSEPNKKIVLMQFTGLKDKNGKEIWEGDVVVGINCVGQIVTKLVEYDEGTFSPLGVHGGCGDSEMSDIKVIGNIYENTNLLT